MNKPPEPALSPLQRVQKAARDKARIAAGRVGEAMQEVSRVLQDADDNLGITERVKGFGAEVDERLKLSDTARATGGALSRGVQDAGAAFKRIADEKGVTDVVNERIVSPITRTSEALVTSDAAKALISAGGDAYGSFRRAAKDLVAPDLPTYDSYELLQATKRELSYVSACILQVSPDESSQIGLQFGRAVTAKVAGATSTAALLGLVATFGHAGTGTALASLSGAAATNATMAWVGGLVGGGMAAGTALTGGLALVAGLAAYRMLSSQRRAFESLSELEQRIAQSCWMLAAVADAYQKRPHEFTADAARVFLEKMLVPLQQDIAANMDALCQPLDRKNALAMRRHVLADFQSAVIDRLGNYLTWADSEAGRAWHATLVVEAGAKDVAASSAPFAQVKVVEAPPTSVVEFAIGGVFAALLTREAISDSAENRLIMEALRRSTVDLRDASEAELGDYLRAQSPEALRGVAANVKGIYHELWYVEQYNARHEDKYARAFEATNHPGSDIQIVDTDTGQVVDEIQLKAVDSSAPIMTHLAHNPHIDVVVTNEVAATIRDGHVEASGVANAQLGGDVSSTFDALRHDTVADRAADTALAALGIVSVTELMQMLHGERRFPEAVMDSAARVGVAAGATALTALLFG